MLDDGQNLIRERRETNKVNLEVLYISQGRVPRKLVRIQGHRGSWNLWGIVLERRALCDLSAQIHNSKLRKVLERNKQKFQKSA